jgi:hypothetical protein
MGLRLRMLDKKSLSSFQKPASGSTSAPNACVCKLGTEHTRVPTTDPRKFDK